MLNKYNNFLITCELLIIRFEKKEMNYENLTKFVYI